MMIQGGGEIAVKGPSSLRIRAPFAYLAWSGRARGAPEEIREAPGSPGRGSGGTGKPREGSGRARGAPGEVPPRGLLGLSGATRASQGAPEALRGLLNPSKGSPSPS